jgi:hypothetical protein
MKRILFTTIVLFFSFSSVGFGWNYSYSRNRLQWSPYANGLVCGDVRYSPYANGLVPDYMYYSPYAFGINSNGLVGLCAYSYYQPNCGYSNTCQCTQSYVGVSAAEYPTQTSYTTVSPPVVQQRTQQSADFTPGGQNVITTWLNSKGISFRTERIMRVEGNLVSVNYLLGDGKIMIKYWNPNEILALQRSGNAQGVYNRYFESWKQEVGKYQASGGKIIQIISSDNQEILSQLESFGS